MAAFDCRMIATIHTTREPARSFVARMRALEGRDGVLSVSLCHGFPWADVEDLGVQVLVVTDDDRARAQALAAELGREIQALRGTTAVPMLGHEEGLERALATAGAPVVLADTSDNAGGGAPSDATFLLRLLLERGVADVALGPFWDPVAVGFCRLAGPGARLRLRLGGKIGPTSGAPLDADALVLHVAEGARQRFAGGWTELGDVGGDPRRRHRDPAECDPHPGVRPGAVHRSRHRARRQEAGGGQVGPALPRRLRAARQGGPLARRPGRAHPGLRAPALHESAAADLAARPAACVTTERPGCRRSTPTACSRTCGASPSSAATRPASTGRPTRPRTSPRGRGSRSAWRTRGSRRRSMASAT